LSLDAAGLRRHTKLIGKRIDAGRVIPFLGAGANLCDRPEGADWRSGRYLPSGSELSRYLAGEYDYPGADARDLVKVAQYVDLVTNGDGALFDELRPVFTGDYRPNRWHRFLAELPARRRAAGGDVELPVVVTTNYDDSLELAFADADEPFDLVYYSAERGESGRFVHLSPEGERRTIPNHTDYDGLDLRRRAVILKIHGDVDTGDADADSYVITEDHYIDYLAHGNLSQLIPAYLMARMRNSHFLFLGYAMRDWNLRVILHHIWSQQVRQYGSWAIERAPDPIDERFWMRHGVEIVEARLEDWIDAMAAPA
jgi:hypothetical protein